MQFKIWLFTLPLRLFFPTSVSAMEWQMLLLLNRDRRREAGLPPLFMQSDLREVAREHSKDMARLHYFEHTNFLGESHADRFKKAQVSEVISGENLAKIGGFPLPVQRAQKGLLQSPGHRANILNKDFNCVGIAVHRDEAKVYYFTQNFARRELLFLGRMPRKIKAGKAFKLKFKPVEASTKWGLYRLIQNKQILREHSFKIDLQFNELKLTIHEEGSYELAIYVGSAESLKLSNQMMLKVVRAGFW